jgi:Domain of unknown function (DUF4148)
MIRALTSAVVIASALAAPAFAFAQSNDPVTRAQVKAELVQLERAGYNPAGDQTHYPDAIQAVEQKVAAQNGTAQSAYGPSSAGTSASGAPVKSASSFDANPVDYNRP